MGRIRRLRRIDDLLSINSKYQKLIKIYNVLVNVIYWSLLLLILSWVGLFICVDSGVSARDLVAVLVGLLFVVCSGGLVVLGVVGYVIKVFKGMIRRSIIKKNNLNDG